MNKESNVSNFVDITKYNNFINTIEEQYKSLYDKLMQNIVYFSTKDIVDLIEPLVLKFISENDNYNIMLPTGKIGSEHFFTLKMTKHLNPVQYLTYNVPCTNDYPILLIDDCVMSGNNMYSKIDDYRYYTKCKNKFYVIVGVLASDPNTYNFSNSYFDAELIYARCLSYLSTKNMFPMLTFDDLYKIFKIETTCVVPLVMEHKLPNSFGSYQFLRNIINFQIDRSKIDALGKKLENQQELFNFIKIYKPIFENQ